MRGRPRKSLEELIADGTFLARRHGELLAGAPADDPRVAGFQMLYRKAGTDGERRKVAIAVEKLCRREATPADPDASRSDVEPDVETVPEFEHEEPDLAREPEPELSYREIIEKVWGTGRTWRDTSVSAEEAHRHSNVEHIPGSMAHPFTWPPLEPPSEPG